MNPFLFVLSKEIGKSGLNGQTEPKGLKPKLALQISTIDNKRYLVEILIKRKLKLISLLWSGRF